MIHRKNKHGFRQGPGTLLFKCLFLLLLSKQELFREKLHKSLKRWQMNSIFSSFSWAVFVEHNSRYWLNHHFELSFATHCFIWIHRRYNFPLVSNGGLSFSYNRTFFKSFKQWQTKKVENKIRSIERILHKHIVVAGYNINWKQTNFSSLTRRSSWKITVFPIKSL